MLDDEVDDIQSLEQTFEDMSFLLGGIEVEAGPAEHDFVTVTYEIFDKVLEVEQLRAAIHEGDIVNREAGLELGVFEKGVEHHVCHGSHLQLDDDAHTLAVALVVDV